jgi:hypothetical protein
MTSRTQLIQSYGIGYEYKSTASLGSWPLIHIASGIDPLTMRPRIARGIVAIGSLSVGVFAIGGMSAGVFAIGGVSFGLLLAIGGVATGLGLSIGGVALGSVAIGGVAAGLISSVSGVPK